MNKNKPDPILDDPYYSREEVDYRNGLFALIFGASIFIGLLIFFSEKYHKLRFVFLFGSILTLIYFFMMGGFNIQRLKKEWIALFSWDLTKDFGSLLLLFNAIFASGIIFYRDDVFFRLDTIAQLSATVGVIFVTILIGLIRTLVEKIKSKKVERFK